MRSEGLPIKYVYYTIYSIAVSINDDTILMNQLHPVDDPQSPELVLM